MKVSREREGEILLTRYSHRKSKWNNGDVICRNIKEKGKEQLNKKVKVCSQVAAREDLMEKIGE